jgi:hypothetical protein
VSALVIAALGCAVTSAVACILVLVVVVHNRLLGRRTSCDNAWMEVAEQRRRRREILAGLSDVEPAWDGADTRPDAESCAALTVQRALLAANTRSLRSAEHVYNEMVRGLNADLDRFPGSVVGRVMGCRPGCVCETVDAETRQPTGVA